MGATPASMAKAAGDRNRATSPVSATRRAAVQGPTPGYLVNGGDVFSLPADPWPYHPGNGPSLRVPV